MDNCVIIGIAGGTGSGKSTFTKRIKDTFGDNVSVVMYDNYYRRHDDLPFEERKHLNYDHPNAFETDLIVKHLHSLKEGYDIECPVYDFTIHNRTDETITVKANKVIIVEGILTLHDSRMRDLFDIKIFVEADADERILRRVIRDVKERGRDVEGIAEQYLTTVKPMHYIYVEPTKALADLVINSGMNDIAFDLVSTKIRDILKG